MEASLFVPLLYHHCQQRCFLRSTFCVKHTTPFSLPVYSMLTRASPAATRWKSSLYATPYRNLGQYLCLVLFVFIECLWLKICVTSGIRVFAKWTSRPREHSVTCPSGDQHQHQHHQHQQCQHQNQHQHQQISIMFRTNIVITVIVKCQKIAQKHLKVALSPKISKNISLQSLHFIMCVTR